MSRSSSDVQKAIIMGGEDFADTEGFRRIQALWADDCGNSISGTKNKNYREMSVTVLNNPSPKLRQTLLREFETAVGSMIVGIAPVSKTDHDAVLAGTLNKLRYKFQKSQVSDKIKNLTPYAMTNHFLKALKATGSGDCSIMHARSAGSGQYEYEISIK